jgi:hypothetical protein
VESSLWQYWTSFFSAKSRSFDENRWADCNDATKVPIFSTREGKKFRDLLFTEFKVEEVVNLSALRFGLSKMQFHQLALLHFVLPSRIMNL